MASARTDSAPAALPEPWPARQPSGDVAELGWRITGGQASALRAVLVLTAWLLGSATAALLAYRRHNIGSAH